MNTSDSIKEIATALAKAQSVMAGAKKDVSNPFFKSKYADLASVWEACRGALTDNGICVVQMTMPSERDEVVVVTRLCHCSGEWMQGELRMPVTKADAQGFGSALTYARRYSLAAAVGVAPEDDDGNMAASAKPARPAFATAHTAKATAEDEFDRMTTEEQQWAREQAIELMSLYDRKQDMYAWWARAHAHITKEEELAIWSLLSSDLRTAFKKQKAAAISKPLAEALGQA